MSPILIFNQSVDKKLHRSHIFKFLLDFCTLAKKLFNDISTSKVKYDAVDSYERLLNIVMK